MEKRSTVFKRSFISATQLFPRKEEEEELNKAVAGGAAAEVIFFATLVCLFVFSSVRSSNSHPDYLIALLN